MPRPLALHLAASLLRAARGLGDSSLTLRVAPSGLWGSHREHCSSGTRYQLEALEAAVPGLEELPPSFPLDRRSLAALIKANFRRHRGGVAELSEGYTTLDQGFAALRAIPEQLYLQQCSSSSSEDGVLVDVVSKWMGSEELPNEGSRHTFTYKVRITNARDATIQVLGRGWDIVDATGQLAGHIPLNPQNAIVGQQPVIPPGCTFEYESGSAISTPTGMMRGRLAVAQLVGLQTWRPRDEWFQVQIAPFVLMRPRHSASSDG